MVRALTSHQCNPGLIPRFGVICGLSLLVFYSALRGFPLGIQKPTFDLICIYLLILVYSVPNYSVLTRILSWGDPGPTFLENKGPAGA